MDEKLYTLALRYLTRRPRSEKEVRDYLSKKIGKDSGLPSVARMTVPVIDSIIARLTEQRFLDDMAFATWWIEQRQILRPVGWRVLQLELHQKGISKDIIEELRSKNQESRSETEFNSALILAQKRAKRLVGAPKDEIYNKIGSFLARRGFDLDTIKAVIDRILEK